MLLLALYSVQKYCLQARVVMLNYSDEVHSVLYTHFMYLLYELVQPPLGMEGMKTIVHQFPLSQTHTHTHTHRKEEPVTIVCFLSVLIDMV